MTYMYMNRGWDYDSKRAVRGPGPELAAQEELAPRAVAAVVLG